MLTDAEKREMIKKAAKLPDFSTEELGRRMKEIGKTIEEDRKTEHSCTWNSTCRDMNKGC